MALLFHCFYVRQSLICICLEHSISFVEALQELFLFQNLIFLPSKLFLVTDSYIYPLIDIDFLKSRCSLASWSRLWILIYQLARP